MGLDIYVYKPIKKNKSLIKDGNFHVLEKNSPLLKKFKNYVFKKDIEYCDFEKTFAKAGIITEEVKGLEWCMSTSTEKSVKTDDVYTLIDHESSTCKKEDYTIIIGNKEDCLFDGEIWNSYYEFQHKDTKKRFVVINPLIMIKREWCICSEEVGYQRKGANKQFYEDGMWDSDYVTERKY